MPYTPSASATAFADTLATLLDSAGYGAMLAGTVPKTSSQIIADALLTTPGMTGGFTIDSKSADFNAAVWTHYRVTTSGGNVIATLPAAVAGNAGQDITIIKLNAANTLTVASASLINGAASQAIVGQWDSVTVRSTGSTWDVVA